MLIKTLTLFVLAFAAACVTANAQVAVLDNLSKNPAAFASTGNSVGQSFVTGGTALSLADVVFLQRGGSNGAYTDGFNANETFALYTNAVDSNTGLSVPNMLNSIGTFSLLDETSLGGFAEIMATPSSAINLTANTRYWLVLNSGSAATTTYWSAADPTTTPYTQNSLFGVTVATDAHTAYKTAGGTTTFYSFAQGPQLLYIEAVPEPSTYGLMAVAGLALVVSRKRTRKLA